MPPAIFAVGGAETPAFQAQNAAMHAAWTARGNHGRTMVVEGADHFTLLRALNSPGAPLFEAVVALGRASDR
jgi:arylformamidase